MDWQRNLLISAMILVLALLYIRWTDFQADHQPPQASFSTEAVIVPEVGSVESVPTPDSGIPNASVPVVATADPQVEQKKTRLITVRTDVLELTIDTYGGDIVRSALLQHREKLDPSSPALVILNRGSQHTYIAQSGLIGPNGTDKEGLRPQFVSDRDHYSLEPGQDTLVIPLLYRQGETLITKQFVLRRGDYLLDVDYHIANHSSSEWRAHLFGQIQRDSWQPPAGDGVGMKPYLGAALTTDDDNYKKISFKDLSGDGFKTDKLGGWVAMLQHYFISAWVPDQNQQQHYNLRKLGDRDMYTFGFTSPVTVVPAGSEADLSASFYVGPKDQKRLGEIASHLDLTIDYGWLWWVAKPIFALMTFIHGLVGNWGWTIILLTVFIKLLFFKLSATSYRSMAKMRKLQPEMARLRELYSDDRQKLSQEMMGFYKREKVNPMGGCLPILVQMPVFIALYWVLFESVELRHAPWILWIKDLSVKDPYFVLPVLNGISMFITTLLQPEPPDPTQAKVMKIMPVAFSFLFAFFPAGLVLYWTVNSVLSILQQWYITRRIEAGKS